jgi:hypothetical protein
MVQITVDKSSSGTVRQPVRGLHDMRLYNIDVIAHLFNDVELHQPALPVSQHRNGVQFIVVKPIGVADVAKPVLQRTVVVHRFQCSPDAAAVVVAAHYNVLDFQYIYGVLNYRHAIEIRTEYHVRNVSMHKHAPRRLSNHFVGRYACIAAADPQNFRCMPLLNLVEEAGLVLSHSLCPHLVRVHQRFQVLIIPRSRSVEEVDIRRRRERSAGTLCKVQALQQSLTVNCKKCQYQERTQYNSDAQHRWYFFLKIADRRTLPDSLEVADSVSLSWSGSCARQKFWRFLSTALRDTL